MAHARAHAADADDLERGVFDLVVIEQHAMGGRQGFAVIVNCLLDVRMDLPRGVIFPVEDRRELVFEEW